MVADCSAQGNKKFPKKCSFIGSDFVLESNLTIRAQSKPLSKTLGIPLGWAKHCPLFSVTFKR